MLGTYLLPIRTGHVASCIPSIMLKFFIWSVPLLLPTWMFCRSHNLFWIKITWTQAYVLFDLPTEFSRTLSLSSKNKTQTQQQQQQLQQKHSTTILNNGFSLVLLGVVHLPRGSGFFFFSFTQIKSNIYTYIKFWFLWSRSKAGQCRTSFNSTTFFSIGSVLLL